MKIKKMNKWKDHFQYLISFDLLSAKERLPNALNDACLLLFKEKNNHSVKNENCVWNITFISFVIITSAEREVKDLRRSGMYQSWLFWQDWARKVCRFSVFSASWRRENRICSRYLG